MNKYKCASCKTETSNIIHPASKGWVAVTGDMTIEYNLDGTCKNTYKSEIAWCSEACRGNYLAWFEGRIGYEPDPNFNWRRATIKLADELGVEKVLEMARKVCNEQD